MAIGIKCYGKVQGVFYRASTKNEADNLRISGWVRNENDGTVRIHAEGRYEALMKLLDWVKKGSDFARVERVESWEEEDEDFTTFEIRRS